MVLFFAIVTYKSHHCYVHLSYTYLLRAGISTSAGIPDFRGPNGIWTREQQNRKQKKKKKNGAKKKEPTLDEEEKSEKGDASRIERSSSFASALSDGKNEDNSGNDHDVPLQEEQSNRRKKRKSDEVNGGNKPKFISFETALPTYTHKALTHLILHPPPSANDKSSKGNGSNDADDDIFDDECSSEEEESSRTYLHHIVTQNVDGLHRKTNLPRDKMSVLHGCIFTEICDTCNTEHVSKTEIQSIGLKHTGRDCTLGGSPPGSCPGKLKDTLLDWEDALPDIDWDRAQEECAKADLVLCLGTSLRIEPAASLCTYPTTNYDVSHDDWGGEDGSGEREEGKRKKKRASPQKKGTKLGYIIVNLQQTPYDDKATLVMRAKVDDVMRGLMSKLGYASNWDGDNEQPATKRSRKSPLPAEKAICQLTYMGFDREAAIEALKHTDNNVEAAANRLLTG